MALSFRLLQPLAKAERLAKEFENVRAVRQSVEQGGRQMLLSHHVLPLSKFEVGGDDHSDPLVEG